MSKNCGCKSSKEMVYFPISATMNFCCEKPDGSNIGYNATFSASGRTCAEAIIALKKTEINLLKDIGSKIGQVLSYNVTPNNNNCITRQPTVKVSTKGTVSFESLPDGNIRYMLSIGNSGNILAKIIGIIQGGTDKFPVGKRQGTAFCTLFPANFKGTYEGSDGNKKSVFMSAVSSKSANNEQGGYTFASAGVGDIISFNEGNGGLSLPTPLSGSISDAQTGVTSDFPFNNMSLSIGSDASAKIEKGAEKPKSIIKFVCEVIYSVANRK